jgi:hypothetical protein
MARLNAQEVVKILINKMFEIAGHDINYEQLLERKDDWYNQYTWTEEQCKEWKKFGTEFLNKKYKMTKKGAESQMAMLNLNYGLKVQQ